MNSFWRPGVSLINTASILCFMKVSFWNFNISSNMYCLNYLCSTWSDGRHLDDSSIALFLKSLTLPNVYAIILCKLVMTLMGFPKLRGAFHTLVAHECTKSQLNYVRHAQCAVPQCRPPDTGGLKGWLQLTSHRVIWGSIISANSKHKAISKLKMIKNVLQI